MTKYIHILVLLAVIIPLGLVARSGKVPQLNPIPEHPRILLLNNEENEIRTIIANNPVWANMHRSLLKECDDIINLPPVERIQIGRRLLDKSREALRRIFYLSYAYRISQEEKYLKRAEQELLAVSAFSDWNPSHFLDVAEMTMAVAIGYDWLHNSLPASSKETIKEAILKKGIEPSFDSRYNGWLSATHNWNQVCNAGMAYGAMAIYEDKPELAQEVINRAVETIVLPMGDYAPDGDYPEGYGYWGYGTSFNVMFISAIEKLYKNDFELSNQPGFLKTAGYLEFMTGPSGNAYNYADSGLGGGLQPAMFWFASKLKDPSLLWIEKTRLENNTGENYVKNRLLPAIMIWSMGVDVKNIKAPSANIWVGNGKNPVALMRTSWTDPNAIYVGAKAGSPSVNHAHMDIGSFIMEANGVRWAIDFGMQSYETLESKGVKLWGRDQNSQRWEVFRYNNRVHNTLTVNDELQKVDGYASFHSYNSDPDFLSATTDMTQLYKGLLAKSHRGIAISNKQYVIVRDEIETLGDEATIRWSMLTSADVKITGKNEAELTKDGKKLILRVNEPSAITMKTWSTDPPRDYDAPNPGTVVVGFEVKVPANQKQALTVLLIPEGKQVKAKVQPLEKWTTKE